MALTAYGKNESLAGATKKMEWANCMSAKTLKAEASAAGTKIKLSKAETEGFTNGTPVFIAKLEGGAGLVEKRTYWVVGAKTNELELALEEGGMAVSFTTEVKAGTELAAVKEISGGENERVKLTWATPSKGETSAAAVKIKIPPSTTIVYAGYWEGKTTGKLTSVEKLEHEETFNGAGEYELTTDKLEGSPLVA